MKTIQVYDLPMCCSTGICGTDIDPYLVNFAAMLSQLGTQDERPVFFRAALGKEEVAT